MVHTAVDQSANVQPLIRFDEDGFLIDHQLWNEELARDLAHQEGVDHLGEQHWHIIHHIRERYLSL
ncbi:MAG: hypothetical protein B6D71_02205, partial [gamma proteobacterium symbiont of Stewartia floridana]